MLISLCCQNKGQNSGILLSAMWTMRSMPVTYLNTLQKSASVFVRIWETTLFFLLPGKYDFILEKSWKRTRVYINLFLLDSVCFLFSVFMYSWLIDIIYIISVLKKGIYFSDGLRYAQWQEHSRHLKKKVNRSAALFLVFLVLLIISMESKLFWLSF